MKNNKTSSHSSSEKTVTLANIIAMLGLCLLGVFTYIGQSYKGTGNIIANILLAVWITAFSAFLLWFLIKAKGAENSLEKWRVLEWCTLGVYAIFIVCSLCGSWGAYHFFSINGNKSDLQRMAREDLAKIESVYELYCDSCSSAIESTCTNIAEAIKPGASYSVEVELFMRNNHIDKLNPVSVSKYEEYITESCYTPVKEESDKFAGKKNTLEDIVNNWNVIKLAGAGAEIEILADSAKNVMMNCSKFVNVPKISQEYDENKRYVMGEAHEDYKEIAKNFKGAKEIKFFAELKDGSDFSFSALILILLIHGLILFNYIVAYRTKTLRPVKGAVVDDAPVL